jgi:hypothetical protein
MSRAPTWFDFGDHSVVIDHYTANRPTASREFNFRVKRGNICTVYRVDVPIEEVKGLTPRQEAQYLREYVRHRTHTKLFCYQEAE